MGSRYEHRYERHESSSKSANQDKPSYSTSKSLFDKNNNEFDLTSHRKDDDWFTRKTSERRGDFDWLDRDTRTLIDDLERECASPVRPRSRIGDGNMGEIHAEIKQEYKSKVNDKVTNDTSRNQSFHRSFKTAEEQREAERSLNRMLDDEQWKNRSLTSSSFDRLREPEIRSLLPDTDSMRIPVRHSYDSGNKSSNYSTKRESEFQRSSSRTSNRSASPGVRFHEPLESSRYSDRSPSRFNSRLDSDWPSFSPLSAPNEVLKRSNYSTKREVRSSRSEY